MTGKSSTVLGVYTPGLGITASVYADARRGFTHLGVEVNRLPSDPG